MRLWKSNLTSKLKGIMAKKMKIAVECGQIWRHAEKGEVYVERGKVDWSKAPRFCVNPNRKIVIKVL